MDLNLVNLTPHRVNLTSGESFDPSGEVARVAMEETRVSGPFVFVEPGEVEGLPEPQDGVLYLVSTLVRTAVPHRTDVVSPGRLVRDEAGRVTGCETLVMNPPR